MEWIACKWCDHEYPEGAPHLCTKPNAEKLIVYTQDMIDARDKHIEMLTEQIVEIAEEMSIKPMDEELSGAAVYMLCSDIKSKLKVKSDLKEKLMKVVKAAERTIDFLDKRTGVSGQRSELAESLVGLSSRAPRPRVLDPNDIGDLMTYERWTECVESGGFIDYDGWGYYATRKGCDRRNQLRPSQYKKGENPKPLWATHVLWFNK